MHRVRAAFACVAVILALPAEARAQGDVPNVLPPPDHGARTLRGHTFLEPATQETPFITSHIGVRQGVAYYFVPDFPLSADRKTDLRLFALTERLEAQVRILPWLALRVAGDAYLATGLDQASLFYGNSAFLAGGQAGLAVRLYRSRDSGTQLTLRGFGGGAAGNELILPGFVQAVAVRGEQEARNALVSMDAARTRARIYDAVNDLANAAVSDTSQFTAGGSAHFAQTITRVVGLQTSLGFIQRGTRDIRFDPNEQRRVETNTSDTDLRLAAAIGVDAYHVHVPLALLLEYAVVKTYRHVEDESTYVPSSHVFGAGLYYSGRTDLQLGISAFATRNLKAQEATALDGTRTMTGIPTLVNSQFVLRYIWN